MKKGDKDRTAVFQIDEEPMFSIPAETEKNFNNAHLSMSPFSGNNLCDVEL